MANVLNKITKEYRRSVNTPSYSSVDWLINPDVSQCVGIPEKYWIIPESGNVITVDRLQYAKDVKITLVDNERDRLLIGGFVWRDHVFNTSPEDVSNITAIVTSVSSGVPLPANFGWRTRDNQTISLTEYEMIDFGATAMNRFNYIYGVSWFHKDTLATLPTIEHVNGYNIMLGWPPEVPF